jgi:hypothetical protein
VERSIGEDQPETGRRKTRDEVSEIPAILAGISLPGGRVRSTPLNPDGRIVSKCQNHRGKIVRWKGSVYRAVRHFIQNLLTENIPLSHQESLYMGKTR